MSSSFYGDCPKCGGGLDMAYNSDTGQERLQCTDCTWCEDDD